MQYYVIPDTASLRIFNFFTLELLDSHPQWFKDNLRIGNCYGILFQTAWAGGRFLPYEGCLDYEQAENVIKEYKKHNVQYQFTFTNSLIIPEMLNDYNGNLQLKLANENNCSVLVASDVLLKYIKDKYPNIEIVSSVTKMLDFDKTLKELQNDDYTTVVINNMLNMELNNIPVEYRKKSEIMVYNDCPFNCPYQKQCYENQSIKNLFNPNKQMIGYGCFNKEHIDYLNDIWGWIGPEKIDELLKIHLSITRETVDNLYNLGFNKFKITGREAHIEDVAMFYAYYFHNKDYRYELTSALLYELNRYTN